MRRGADAMGRIELSLVSQSARAEHFVGQSIYPINKSINTDPPGSIEPALQGNNARISTFQTEWNYRVTAGFTSEMFLRDADQTANARRVNGKERGKRIIVREQSGTASRPRRRTSARGRRKRLTPCNRTAKDSGCGRTIAGPLAGRRFPGSAGWPLRRSPGRPHR